MPKTGERDERHARFWDLVDPLIGQGRLVEGTMMGHHCVRAAGNDGFVATVERSSGNLVVKLSRRRVAELVEAGEGLPFAPANRVFKEWVAVPPGHADAGDARWRALLEESIAFVDGA
jgi:hypothetical protein